MNKLRVIDAKRFEKLLFALDFKKARQKGSHIFYRHADGRYTTLPHHKGGDLSRPMTRAILKEVEITVDEHNKLLKK